MKARLLALLWGLLLATAMAQGLRRADIGSRAVTFNTVPTGAVVTLIGVQPQVLGLSGQPVSVPVPLDMNVTLQFSFTLDGYERGQYAIQSASLREPDAYSYPADGTNIVMIPASTFVYLRDMARQHVAAVASGVGFLLLMAVGALWFVRRLVRQARRQATMDLLGVPQRTKAATMDDFSLVGKTVGNWLLVDRLGKGGMAVVYKGIPNDTLDRGTPVAVKVINADNLNDPQARSRFEREVRIGAKLDHPNIVRLIDWDMTGPCYLVMELVDGVPLRGRITPDGMIPRAALQLMGPVFDAMIYAHDQGVWHRDLKPENIFISQMNKITVMDFGISRQANDVTVTATGQMPVTPGYMSPEQFSGKGVGAAADQYTLGIMMWELLVGRRPFEDESPMVVVMQHVGTPLPSITQLKPDVPEEIDWVVQRMCAKEPLRRYPSLRAAADALDQASRGG